MIFARTVAAENLGQLVFDPTLGYCAPLSLDGDAAEADLPGWSALRIDGVVRPVRAFFRRVGMQLDERVVDERTVCPAAQAWQALALLALSRETPLAYRLALRCLRFVFEQLIRDDGAFAPRIYEAPPYADDWLAPLEGTGACVLDALVSVDAHAPRCGAPIPDELDGWVAAALRRVEVEAAADGTVGAARALGALVRMQARPRLYHVGADYLIWSLLDRLQRTQEPDGSWEGMLRPTAEAVAALAAVASAEPRLSLPDTLAGGVAWLYGMQRRGRGLPLPQHGLRVYEYSLHDLAALLEAARLVAGVGDLHPDDRATMARLGAAWRRFALGRRIRLPRRSRHAGMWVAGMQFVPDQAYWRREPFVEPGAVGRMAFECLAGGRGEAEATEERGLQAA